MQSCAGHWHGPSPHAWGELPRVTVSSDSSRTISTRVGRTLACWYSSIANADHPHTRGENIPAGTAYDAQAGPSPHAWGEPVYAAGVARDIISGPSPHAWENFMLAVCLHPAPGPSPHAWGELPGARLDRLEARTIPTRVGRTCDPRGRRLAEIGPSPHAWGELPGGTRTPCALKDHPHTRGENLSLLTRNTADGGPSPHAWGERTRRANPNPPHRTIPTRVGRTGPGNRQYVYGGPSPHAWGEQHPRNRSRGARRTIPTRVGRTNIATGDPP